MHGNTLLTLGCPIKFALFFIFWAIYGHFFKWTMPTHFIISLLTAWTVHALLVFGVGALNVFFHDGNDHIGQPVWPDSSSTDQSKTDQSDLSDPNSPPAA